METCTMPSDMHQQSVPPVATPHPDIFLQPTVHGVEHPLSVQRNLDEGLANSVLQSGMVAYMDEAGHG